MVWRWLKRVGLTLGAAASLVVSLCLLAVLLGHLSLAVPSEKQVDRSDQFADAVRSTIESAPVDQVVVSLENAPTPASFSQSPILDDLVASKKLPEVAQRLPERPLVMRSADGIGKHGGTWVRMATSQSDMRMLRYQMSYASALRWSPRGDPIVPHLAESVVASEDLRTFTFTLRRGHRWSDGHPFTTDDVMYRWEKEIGHPKMGSGAPPFWLMNGADAPRIEKIDQQKFRVEYDQPNAMFLRQVASYGADLFVAPRHFLEKYHPFEGDPEIIAREMAANALASARSLYNYVRGPMNPEHPRLWPWVCREYKANPPYTFVRNPYYFAVDEAGQQLPYVDSLQYEIIRLDQIPINVASGKVSMQQRHLRFTDITEYLTRQQAGTLDVKLWESASRSMWVLNPNLNRRVSDDDPGSPWKAELLGDKRFRQAMSLALDRQRIIDAEYIGLGEPSQVNPGPSSRFNAPVMASAYTQHDPAAANALLDELGLERSRDGYRRFPDGTPMVWFIDYTSFTGRGPADFVIEDWDRVGVRAIARERARSLFLINLRGRTGDFIAWASESDVDPLASPRYFVPWQDTYWAYGWGLWNLRGGADADPADLPPAAIEPPADHPVRESIALFKRIRTEPDIDQQVELFQEIAAIAAEQVWSIAIATSTPQPVAVDPNLKGVPDHALAGWIYQTPGNTGIETFWFAENKNSPGARRQIARAIERVVPRPSVNTSASSEPGDGGRWPWRSVVVIAVLMALAFWGLRNPYVGRRLLIMIPTLVVMSVIIFTIIQLPPGDYLMARVVELQEQGDTNAEAQIADLKELFRYDDPAWKQYLRWSGLMWFTSFDASDTGLLQGNLGRSMESGQPVGAVVGDRILLTVLISLASILFTWAVAIPIGIYSAVRQYTLGDYAFTLVGFLGMSIPNFLLALVLMTLAGVSGLFSPEFATQPEWNWAKFVDLLKHIWVPVIVLGTGGTAYMIRVMRANLLDELKKPYVVTARAKGVKPMKMILKYPVRLAINPFISGIGGLLPQLISGGTIVAMVLSLPTVGPLMLAALLQEDMYLAGSMLMVLSMLGIVGTLLSDLLLLVVDPRIRFEGGGR